MPMADYKQAKEAFVSGSTGGTIARINSVCLTALTTYALFTVLESRIGSTWFASAVLEFLILVVPLLLSLTVLSAHPIYLNAALSTLVVLLHFSLKQPSKPLEIKSKSTDRALPSSAAAVANKLSPRAFVTVYRSHMMLMTIICILAVDFKVFPREFAKAETWGTSLMDLGVGSFVFSFGLVSALPLLRTTKRKSFLPAVLLSIQKSAGVLALGLVRVIMVKGVDYPEHVSEYGVHWNFFFTLGLLPVAGDALNAFAPNFDITGMALVVIAVHQLALDFTSLQDWTLNAARTTLISQNKEGLVSLPGYLAIYLIGMGAGLFVLPPDPSFFYRSRSIRRSDSVDEQEFKEKKIEKAWKEKPGKLMSVLGSLSVLWCSGYGISRWLGWEVSRRLANLPYVLWIASFNTSFLCAYLILHTWAASVSPSGKSPAPMIFEAINRNGLVVFLAANLLTGLVNISIESMYASDGVATAVMIAYCAAVFLVAWVVRNRRLRM